MPWDGRDWSGGRQSSKSLTALLTALQPGMGYNYLLMLRYVKPPIRAALEFLNTYSRSPQQL